MADKYTQKENRYGHSVRIDGPCVIRYEPEHPLSCGAMVWIETEAEVDVQPL